MTEHEFEIYKHNDHAYEIEYREKIIAYAKKKKEAYNIIKQYAIKNNIKNYFIGQLNFE